MKTVIAPLVLGAGGLALVGAGAPIGGLVVAAKAGAGAAVSGAPTATVTAGAASTSTFSGAMSSAVSATAGAFASAAAAATGGSMAAGALAVAAVGMVAALQITAPADADPMVDTVIATHEGRELPESEEIKDGEPVLPTDVEPGENTTYLVVDYTDASQPLAARKAQDLSLTVENKGNTAATGTQLEITLPPGLTVAKPDGPFGTGVGGRLVSSSKGSDDDGTTETPTPTSSASAAGGDAASGTETGGSSSDGETQALPTSSPSAPTSADAMPTEGPAACMPSEQENVLVCSLGELAPGAKHGVAVQVEANSGGDYPVGAKVWADGVEPVAVDLPDRTVAPFGPELSAQTEDVSLASPGVASLPVRLVSTGDLAVAPAGWSVEVTLPAGVTPTSTQSALSCVPAEMPNAWLCAPHAGTDAAAMQLDPGATVDVPLNITTATPSSGEPAVLGAASIRPVLTGNAHSASATLVATSAWANAADGVGTVAAECLAKGGVGKADAAVIGTYTNTTQRNMRVTLEAAGGSASTGKELAPGEATRLTVNDGLRVPAGQGVFVLATDVEGRTYETRISAGDHGQMGCYSPAWDTATSVQTVNAGGTVAVEGTLTNTTDESLTAVMSVPLGDETKESVKVPVSAGGSVTFTVNTGRTHLAAGEVTFHLSREVEDADGDPADRAFVPDVNPTERYDDAVIQPARGPSTMSAECVFDVDQDRSVQTFGLMADNTASTLPVKFHIGDLTKTVPAGKSEKFEFPVTWGTNTVTLEAAGQVLDEIDVRFNSCAELDLADTEQVSVAAAAACVEGTVQLTAAVENRTGRDWTGVLIHDGTGEAGPEQAVGAGTTTLELRRQTPFSFEGNVTVRLTRELEGAPHAVERSFAVDSEACWVKECEPTSTPSPEPSATIATTGLGRWTWPGTGLEVCREPEPDQA